MDKIVKYKLLQVVEEGGVPVWKETPIVGVMIDSSIGKITNVKTINEVGAVSEPIAIDDKITFVQESTGVYDKLGTALYGGDIVKLPVKLNDAEPVEMMLAIIWIEGAWCLCVENADVPIYLTNQNTLTMEKVGNIPQHGTLVEKPIDEAIKENMENQEAQEVAL